MSLDFNEKEIWLYYKPGKKKDKNTYNLAKQISEHVNDFDIIKNPPTETQLKEMLMLLKLSAENIVETESDTYRKKYKDVKLDETQWIKAMVSDPDLIKTPIAFKGKRGIVIDTPSSVLDLDPKHGYNSLNE